MNEPSPEAKQAAKKWGTPEVYRRINYSLPNAYADGYDAATAKAREELEISHRLEQAAWKVANERLDQQPKMPCTCGDDYRDIGCPVHGDTEHHQQPSAPTADVEKSAREAAHNIDARLPYGFTNDETDIVEDEIRNASAQSRASLVKMLEQLRAYCSPTGNMLIDAAIAGTGEKALAGKTGNKQTKESKCKC